MAWHRAWVIMLAFLYSLVLPAYAEESLLPLTALLSSHTRLLIFAPHPDDEILGAGGLIQRVLHLGGVVQVVFMTSGDGFPSGVEMIRQVLKPTAQDYREYGQLRQTEATQALATLGVPEKAITFLRFPDGGLCSLRMQYKDDAGPCYTSPFTLADHPPSAAALLPDIKYTGKDLRREITWILGHFRPSLIVIPHPRDQHPDHCSTYFFVRTTLHEFQQHDSRPRPVLLTFLVHYSGWWPMTKAGNKTSTLRPPQDFPTPERAWIPFPLSPTEVQIKRQALLQYHSQILAMGQYLLSFVRANELFARDSLKAQRTLPQPPCCRR